METEEKPTITLGINKPGVHSELNYTFDDKDALESYENQVIFCNSGDIEVKSRFVFRKNENQRVLGKICGELEVLSKHINDI